MNQEQLRRIVVWQYILVLVATVGGLFFGGVVSALSALAGGLCVAVPNSVLALFMLRKLNQRVQMQPLTVIVGELLKLLVTCALFVLVAKFYSNLNWAAMIAGIILAACSQFVLIFIKH